MLISDPCNLRPALSGGDSPLKGIPSYVREDRPSMEWGGYVVVSQKGCVFIVDGA